MGVFARIAETQRACVQHIPAVTTGFRLGKREEIVKIQKGVQKALIFRRVSGMIFRIKDSKKSDTREAPPVKCGIFVLSGPFSKMEERL